VNETEPPKDAPPLPPAEGRGEETAGAEKLFPPSPEEGRGEESASAEAAPSSASPPAEDAAPAIASPPPPEKPSAPVRLPRAWLAQRLREPEEIPVGLPVAKLRARSRRDFFLFGAGALAATAGLWWLLPDDTKQKHLTPRIRDWLDSLEARLGATSKRRERFLDRALTFDDDVAEALYSPDRSVRTYSKSQVTPLRNNYEGATPGPEYLPGWTLTISGLASGRVERLTIGDLLARFPRHDQVTRLCCVEGWSMVAWWGGLRFADLLAAYSPAPGARWARLDSSVNLDSNRNPDPYYVSIDLPTARHPQTLLATQVSGKPLPLAHGAPLRLLAPMKLGLKNIKAITAIAYSAAEPADYWNERGYSRYDGL